MRLERGTVLLLDLGPTAGREQRGTRPCVVVSDPEVTVVVLQVNSKSVYVLGEVARQGPVSLRQNMRVVDVLSHAGGFSAFADKDNILIIRGTDEGAPKEFRFNYDTFVDGTDVAQDVLLLPGDKIVVP